MSSKINTSDRILNAALKAIEEDPHDINVSRVSEIAGISRQGIYLHFKDKREILVAAARHLDERLDLEGRLKPLNEAQTADSLLSGLARFLGDYNPLLYPIVRAVDAVRKSDPDVEEAWKDRLANRKQGCLLAVMRLHEWRQLSPNWTVKTASIWLTSQSSVKLWEELVVDLGWSKRQYVKTLNLVFKKTLLI